VRVSGFLSEEEKKYQQKSITSFLKSGKEIDLRLQPGKSSQESARQQNSENLPPHEAVGKQLFHDRQTPAHSAEEGKKATDIQSSDVCKIFTCPVCFKLQNSNDLEELNRHIDECLSGTLVQDTVEVSKTDSPRENTPNCLPECRRENTDKCQVNETVQLAGAEQSAGTSVSSADNSTDKCAQVTPDRSLREQQPSNLSDIAREVCMKQSVFPTRLSQGNEDHVEQTEHTEGTSSSCVLVCPVCNLEQKTTSLVWFNRHVDVCLNKGLIQELTEQTDLPSKSYDMENSNSIGGLSKGQQCTNPSQGTKRSGQTTSQSISKKAKVSNSKHTIEMFFK
ncbi:PREDICTED: DNA polymerase kappa-like, partial [Acanthisitta chloris]|uniref:DNA polymerase kappa-like n=1 Tax=Acanthisitta chloris TaxID=57068 RepID=UPI0004F0ED33